MPANDAFITRQSYEMACGKGGGLRNGGISVPQKVLIPQGSTLIRLYNDNGKNEWGAWWTTTFELGMILDNVAAGWKDKTISTGRASGAGESILHRAFAILREWDGGDPVGHLGAFKLVVTLDDIWAWYGVGRKASSDLERLFPVCRSVAKWQGAMTIKDTDGRPRPVRQLMLPSIKEYVNVLNQKVVKGSTDAELIRSVDQYLWWLPFELR